MDPDSGRSLPPIRANHPFHLPTKTANAIPNARPHRLNPRETDGHDAGRFPSGNDAPGRGFDTNRTCSNLLTGENKNAPRSTAATSPAALIVVPIPESVRPTIRTWRPKSANDGRKAEKGLLPSWPNKPKQVSNRYHSGSTVTVAAPLPVQVSLAREARVARGVGGEGERCPTFRI